jgi:hypothetical protein
MKVSEVHTASQVFLSGSNIEFSECFRGIISGINVGVEIVSDIVHEE